MRNKKVSIGMTVVLAAVMVMTATPAAAQTETVLYNFTSANEGPYIPCLSLAFDASGNLYGSAQYGGSAHSGELFQLAPNPGGGWTTKFIFDFKSAAVGLDPTCGLVVDAAGNLYGMTYAGGPFGWGTAYELSPNGNGSWTQKILHYFSKIVNDGQFPLAGMALDSAGNLYGTTEAGGNYRAGTVFELTPQADGSWTEKVLYNFGGSSTDAANPQSSVVFDSAGNLYGETEHGGANSGGAVYKLSPQSDGSWAETVLYNFSYYSEPSSSLVFDSKGNLYGTTAEGGAYGFGSVFELSPKGGGTWNEKTLHNFSLGNKDGFNVFAGLIFDKAGNLYGATMSGGAFGGINGYGTVYKLTPKAGGGWTKSTLFSFDATDGAGPTFGNLVLDASGNLYGGAGAGGAYGGGVVFEITP